MDCPCCSNKSFKSCCGRFLDEGASPKTPEQLMRSRYSAYAIGGYGDYLVQSWHHTSRKHLNPDDLSKKTTQWQRLEIIDKSQRGNQGEVEFKAYFIDQDGISLYLHERSEFVREGGQWFYVNGTIY